MGGPVRKSPAAEAREEEAGESAYTVPGSVAIAEQAATTHQPVSLVEKFAQQMGGVEPSKMLRTLKATAFRLPDKKNYGSGNWTPQEVTNEQMMALLVVANKYGLNPFIKEIYAFPDKGGIVPIVGVDGWSRMINDHDQYDGMKFANSEKDSVIDEHAKRCPEAITCIIYRKDRSHPTEVTEYLDEVYRPAFEKNGEVKPGPWQSHTKRMLRHKAMIQCARIAFGFTGIHDQDEAERIVASDYVIVNEGPTQAAALTDRFKPAEDATCDHVWLLDEMTKLGDTVACRDCPETKIYELPIEGEVIPRDDAHVMTGGLPDLSQQETSEPEPEAPNGGIKEEGQPPPDAKPKPEKKPAKKPAPKPTDPTAKFMDRIIAAKDEAGVTKILTEVAEVKGLSAAKRTVLKRAAQAKMKEFDGED